MWQQMFSTDWNWNQMVIGPEEGCEINTLFSIDQIVQMNLT